VTQEMSEFPGPASLEAFTLSVSTTVRVSVSKVFAARRSALGGGYCYGDVAVCVAVTLMYCVKTTESITMRPSPDCSPAILVFR